MGGGVRGNFGNTQGSREYDWRSVLDSVSNVLTGASLIPGLDTFADLASIPVDLARGDYVSAGLSALGVIPFVGEVADTAKLAKIADKTVDAAKATKKIQKTIKNPIVHANRVGSAKKIDKYHNFSNIVDNYANNAKKFKLKGGDGKIRTLYQAKGSLNGKDGVFEWILDKNKGVTHRRFIEGAKITGKPNFR